MNGDDVKSPESVAAIEPEWIGADISVDVVAGAFPSRKVAKDALADMLIEGRLTAKADRSWWANEQYRDAWRNRENYEFDENVIVTKREWKNSKNWLGDQALWRWDETRFILTISLDQPRFRFLEGMKFLAADLNALTHEVTAPPKPKGKGGRRPDYARWQNFWMEVVDIARSGKLVSGQYQSQEALIEDILAAMQGKVFDEETVREPVRQIWKRFCDR